MFFLKKILWISIPLSIVILIRFLEVEFPDYYYGVMVGALISIVLYTFFLVGEEYFHGVLYGGLASVCGSSFFYIYSIESSSWSRILVLTGFVAWFLLYFYQVLYFGRAKMVGLPERTISIFNYSAYGGMFFFFVSIYSVLLNTTIPLILLICIAGIAISLFYYFCFWLRRTLYTHAWTLIVSGTCTMLQIFFIVALTSLTFYIQAFLVFAYLYLSLQLSYHLLDPKNYLLQDVRSLVIKTGLIVFLVLMTAQWI